MQSRPRKPLIGLGLAALPASILAGALAVADPPVTTTLSNGASLAVEIQQPTHDQEFRVPPGGSAISVGVTGQASVGKGEPDATVIYVIDESGSTGTGGGTGCSPILDCEEKFFIKLNDAVIADGSTDLVGVVHYGAGSTIALGLTPPGSAAVDSAILAASPAGTTNCAAGLNNARTLAISGANTNGTTIVVFASDGRCNTGGAVAPAASALGATGAIVHSVAIGSGSDCTTDENGTGTLNQIPQNGGTCTEVADPGNLPNIIQNLIGSSLDALSIQTGSSYSAAIPNSEISLPLPQPGAVSVSYGPTTLAGLGPATHNICVTAEGSDVLGDQQAVIDCHDIQLLQLTASPVTATNNLNFDDSHTVTAALVGGTGPARDISFAIGGHNAASAAPGAGAVSATPNTPVSFSYSVPKDCASLGSDTITVRATIAGTEDTIVLGKTWIDDVKPNVSCDPTVNPHGKNVPGGTNEDGFYQLNAADPHLANCTVTLEVKDSDGFVFPGPFAPGDKVKYTEANGAPQSQKKMGADNGQAGAIRYHLKGHGDLVVTATDPSGNSASVICRVAPPPK